MPIPPRWRGLALAAGATPLLLAFPLFRLAVRLYAQIGLWRTAGTLAVVVAAGTLLVAFAWQLTRPWLAERAAWLLGVLAAANLAAVGLAIWFISPRLAPSWALALATAGWAAFALAFWRQDPAERRLAARGLLGAGGAAALALLLLLPGVAAAAWDDGRLAPVGPTPVPAAARPDRPDRIVLVTIDALRARSVDLRAGGRTPNFARLAAEATAFPHAYAVADATMSSVPTLLSGLGVNTLEAARTRWTHGRLLGAAPSNALREGLVRGLPAQLGAAGYRRYYATKLIAPELLGMAGVFEDGFAYAPISALVNNFNLREFLPFPAIWRDLTHRPYPPGDHAGAIAENLARAEAFYKRPDPHAFVWVHLGVPHTPYREIVRRPDGTLVQTERNVVDFDDVATADAAGLARIEAGYEAQIPYLDQELGRFLDHLRQDPRWADTLLLVTADHGEAFHAGLPPHGTGQMSEDLVHVPLLVHAPGQHAGRVEAGLASGLDVTPTLVAAAFRPLPAYEGRDLSQPLPADRVVASWGLYQRQREGGDEHGVAAYQDGFKYLRLYPGSREALYRLPDDGHDVAKAEPARLAALRAYVERNFELPR